MGLEINMGGSSNMVCGPSKADALASFLNADVEFDKAKIAREKANANEEFARQDWHKTKDSLARAVGYKIGDHPLSVAIGDGRVVRFYTRTGSCRRDDSEVCVSIERVI